MKYSRDSRDSMADMTAYASPQGEGISWLMFLLILHALLTATFFMMTLVTDLNTESYFYACKSFHVLLPLFGAYFAAIAYNKRILSVVNKLDFLDNKMLLALALCFSLCVIDCVFFGKDAVPTLMDCYQSGIPPAPFCDTDGRKLVYTVHVSLRAAHIVSEALIFFVILWVRCSSSGDALCGAYYPEGKAALVKPVVVKK